MIWVQYGIKLIPRRRTMKRIFMLFAVLCVAMLWMSGPALAGTGCPMNGMSDDQAAAAPKADSKCSHKGETKPCCKEAAEKGEKCPHHADGKADCKHKSSDSKDHKCTGEEKPCCKEAAAKGEKCAHHVEAKADCKHHEAKAKCDHSGDMKPCCKEAAAKGEKCSHHAEAKAGCAGKAMAESSSKEGCHAKMAFEVINTTKGVKVEITSKDPEVVKTIQARFEKDATLCKKDCCAAVLAQAKSNVKSTRNGVKITVEGKTDEAVKAIQEHMGKCSSTCMGATV